jgi:homoserine O-acetyltransferase/O-succinyltransferase
LTRPQAAAQFDAEEALVAPCPLGADHAVSIPADWRLENGQPLGERSFLTRLYGPEDAPLVAVAGGISSGRFIWTGDDGGWWASLVGPERAVDFAQWRVLAFDFAPLNDRKLEISPVDQARLLALALDDLGEPKLHAYIGASYGGMVGLAFAERFPERIDRLCVISAAHRPSAMGVAWRGVQRRILHLAEAAGRPEEGLALARELAMTTYRTPEEFAARFDTRLGADGQSEVCRYLIRRGRDFVGAASPQRWASLSASIDRHSVEPSNIGTPTTLVACTSDRLTPLSDMAELGQSLSRLDRFVTLDSLYGHDAFLKETEQLAPVLNSFLKD